jgi:hypothetical protein
MYLTIAKYVGIALAVGLIGWGLYAGLIRPTTKPNPSTAQQADNIVNYNYSPRVSFGCAYWKIKPNEKVVEAASNSTGSNP